MRMRRPVGENQADGSALNGVELYLGIDVSFGPFESAFACRAAGASLLIGLSVRLERLQGQLL